MNRISKENYYLDIAQTVATRSTCLRKSFGAIIVKNDTIISTGYNGAPRGRKNCSDLGYCMRDNLGIPRGERYELCRSVHAEANAIIAASREQIEARMNAQMDDEEKCRKADFVVYNDGTFPLEEQLTSVINQIKRGK